MTLFSKGLPGGWKTGFGVKEQRCLHSARFMVVRSVFPPCHPARSPVSSSLFHAHVHLVREGSLILCITCVSINVSSVVRL